MINKEDPVYVIHSITNNTVFVYGYGTFKDSPVNSDVNIGKANIVLDSGENINDLECLWGDPDVLGRHTANKQVVLIDPIQVRKSQNTFNWSSFDLGQIN